MNLRFTLSFVVVLATGVRADSIFGTVTSAITAILDGIVNGDSQPEVTLDYGTFRGLADVVTKTDNFLGVPFGVAPRFDHSYLPNTTLDGVQLATQYGSSCPQQEFISLVSLGNLSLGGLLSVAETVVLPSVLDQSEDCLNINVQVPSDIPPGTKLPVMIWIHGGAFTDGAAAAFAGETTAVPGVFYQSGKIVQRSIEMEMPVIVVSANYRLNAFGFSGGKEMADAGVANLAIEDQRLAMKWVQKYIAQFGGDPNRVTIFGNSAGAWSVNTHLVANDGDNEGLFHGAIALSGGPIDVDGQERAQPVFDAMAKRAGCGLADNKLACLRKAPFEDIYAFVQEQPFPFSSQSLASIWAPRPDGQLLGASPHQLVSEGKFANVPIVIGDMKDEGTLFSLVSSLSVLTDDDFKKYFKSTWWPHATNEQLDQLMQLYPPDLTQGSPFDTGVLNAITPQYKRLSALAGDYSFQAQRRHLIDNVPEGQNVWTYQIESSLPILGDIPLIKDLGLANFPVLGSFHASDVLLHVFGTIPATLSRNTRNIMGTMIAFANTLDPNNHGFDDIPTWPKYDKNTKKLYQFLETGPVVAEDTFRQEAMQYINENADSLTI